MAIYMVYEDALALMKRFTPSESLQKHMMAVETAMRAYARKYGQPEEKWAITGILHDFDLRALPRGAPLQRGGDAARDGLPRGRARAILGHVDSPQHPRTTLMSKALFAVDSLVGLITAAVYVRPDKRIQSLELPSLKKKFKDKAFAAKVDREGIVRGAQELGVDLDEHMAFVLEAMKADAARLGLG